jgi:hypothetical protein
MTIMKPPLVHPYPKAKSQPRESSKQNPPQPNQQPQHNSKTQKQK